MCALGQMLEAEGIATVAIGLVRLHMEQTAGPRGLFVPFPLGRPLGEPGDREFQHRVLRAALGLLGRDDGPSVLEEFPEDAPTQAARPGWKPALDLPPPASLPSPASPQDWARALAAEMALVEPAWQRARARLGRTTVGLSAQPPSAWPEYAAAFLAGELPPPPAPLTSPAFGLRFLADDLKAFYTEASQAEGGAPAPRQIDAWLYRETLAAKFLLALRDRTQASDNAGLKAVGRFFVPAHWVPGPG